MVTRNEEGRNSGPIILITIRIYWMFWSHPSESNRRPADYESAALPTELGWPRCCANLANLTARRTAAQQPQIGSMRGPLAEAVTLPCVSTTVAAVGFLDRVVVGTHVTPSHQSVRIELPMLVAVVRYHCPPASCHSYSKRTEIRLSVKHQSSFIRR